MLDGADEVEDGVELVVDGATVEVTVVVTGVASSRASGFEQATSAMAGMTMVAATKLTRREKVMGPSLP